MEHTGWGDYEAIRLTVVFLTERALGRRNAVTGESIVRHLKRKGIRMSVEQWQKGVLVYLMESAVFVGVCDRGFFVIVDEEDVAVAEEYLGAQVDAVIRRLAILRHRAEAAGLLR